MKFKVIVILKQIIKMIQICLTQKMNNKKVKMKIIIQLMMNSNLFINPKIEKINKWKKKIKAFKK